MISSLLFALHFLQERYKQKHEIFGDLGAVPWSVYEEFLWVTGIELDDRRIKMSAVANRMEVGIKGMIQFAKHIPGFCDLCTSDQLALLKGMGLTISEICMKFCFKCRC